MPFSEFRSGLLGCSNGGGAGDDAEMLHVTLVSEDRFKSTLDEDSQAARSTCSQCKSDWLQSTTNIFSTVKLITTGGAPSMPTVEKLPNR